MVTINYEESFAELQAIVGEIEGGSVGIDVLAEKIKRANVLIGLCQRKLTATEAEIKKVLLPEPKEKASEASQEHQSSEK